MDLTQEYALLGKVLQRGYEKVRVLEHLKSVEVSVRSGKLTRNSNPSLNFEFESPCFVAHINFWSQSKTGEAAIYDLQHSEVLDGFGFEISELDDLDPYFDKLINVYLERANPDC